MKISLILFFIFSPVVLMASSSRLEDLELQALLKAQNSQELLYEVEYFQDLKSQLKICALETRLNKLPSACYAARALLVKRGYQDLLDSEIFKNLDQNCLQKAKKTDLIELPANSFLPKMCLEALRERILVNRYKSSGLR